MPFWHVSRAGSGPPTTRCTAHHEHDDRHPIPSNLTMSSLEIAERTGTLHKNVMADVRVMLADLGLNSADFLAQYRDSTGRSLPCFNLPKRETLILVSGYSVALESLLTCYEPAHALGQVRKVGWIELGPSGHSRLHGNLIGLQERSKHGRLDGEVDVLSEVTRCHSHFEHVQFRGNDPYGIPVIVQKRTT